MSPFVDWVTKNCSGVKDQPTNLIENIPNIVEVYSILVNNVTSNPLRVTVSVKGTTNMSIITDYLVEPKNSINALSELGVPQITLNALDTLEVYSNAQSQVFNAKVEYVVLKELS